MVGPFSKNVPLLKTGPTPVSFPIFLFYFKQTMEYLQQINVKIYLESGTVIRTHNFWSMSLLPLPLDQGSCYKICLFTYLRNSVLQNWLVHLICARFAETKFLHLWPCPSLIRTTKSYQKVFLNKRFKFSVTKFGNTWSVWWHFKRRSIFLGFTRYLVKFWTYFRD